MLPTMPELEMERADREGHREYLREQGRQLHKQLMAHYDHRYFWNRLLIAPLAVGFFGAVVSFFVYPSAAMYFWIIFITGQVASVYVTTKMAKTESKIKAEQERIERLRNDVSEEIMHVINQQYMLRHAGIAETLDRHWV